MAESGMQVRCVCSGRVEKERAQASKLLAAVTQSAEMLLR